MKSIYISSNDHRRISKAVGELLRGGAEISNSLRKLQYELNRAIVVDSLALPPGVVTLYSKVQLRDMRTNELEEWVLTMPEHADPEEHQLSVLAPIGTAIIGFSEGDEIEWDTPGGNRLLRIESVHAGAPPETERPAWTLYA